MVWVGVIRYLGYFQKYNVSLVTRCPSLYTVFPCTQDDYQASFGESCKVSCSKMYLNLWMSNINQLCAEKNLSQCY